MLASCTSNTTFVDVFTPGELGYPCIRIPSILLAGDNTTLFAFAEVRPRCSYIIARNFYYGRGLPAFAQRKMPLIKPHTPVSELDRRRLRASWAMAGQQCQQGYLHEDISGQRRHLERARGMMYEQQIRPRQLKELFMFACQ